MAQTGLIEPAPVFQGMGDEEIVRYAKAGHSQATEHLLSKYRTIVEGKAKKVTAGADNMHEFLGPPQFHFGMAEEKDHAGLVAYFASDEAAHVTGQVVAVDGAQSLYHPLTMKRGSL